MPFSFSKDNNNLKLFLSGDIDLEITPDIKSQLSDEIEECSSLDIDGSKVSYIDSSGVSILVIAMQSCAKNDISFTISRLSDQLLRVIELAHLDKLLPIGEVSGQADAEDITDFENTEFTDGDILHDITGTAGDDGASDDMLLDDEAIAAELGEGAMSDPAPDSAPEPAPEPAPQPAPKQTDKDAGGDNASKSGDDLFKPGTF
ncbi:MAG: STAS domain-containing protein [Parvibaculales bacterium]